MAEKGEMIIDSHVNLEAAVIPNNNTGRQEQAGCTHDSMCSHEAASK